MKLSTLLADFLVLPAHQDKEITGLSLDSRDIAPGYLFLAYPGESVDGRQFIDKAIEQGAVAVLCEADTPLQTDSLLDNNQVNLVFISQLRQKVSQIASRFYDHPSSKMTVIGVTGTNGKTSICHYLAQMCHYLGQRCAVLGTVGNGFLNELHQTNLTTPDAVRVQRLLAEFYQQGANVVAMEVSSHSLVQSRVAGVAFDIAVFTNLTRDHIDYHGDMQAYGRAKQQLFDYPTLKYAVLNIDDPFGEHLLENLLPNVKPYTYGIKTKLLRSGKSVNVYATRVQLASEKITANIHTPWGQTLLESGIIGSFNVSNLLAVLTVLGTMGFALTDIMPPLARLKAVFGRMDTIGGGTGPLIVVDYAHTPDALIQVLSALREQCSGQLWCIFGCGGNRDAGKRPLMAQAAERYADHIMVTDDNPRHEDPARIVADIFAGFTHPERVTLEHDREAALRAVIHQAKVGDYILIAGKGHENYQLIGDKILNFNDKEVVERILLEDAP